MIIINNTKFNNFDVYQIQLTAVFKSDELPLQLATMVNESIQVCKALDLIQIPEVYL